MIDSCGKHPPCNVKAKILLLFIEESQEKNWKSSGYALTFDNNERKKSEMREKSETFESEDNTGTIPAISQR